MPLFVGASMVLHMQYTLHGIAHAIYLDSQTGGMKHRFKELSMLFVRLHAEIVRHDKAAGFILFADLKSAFHSVIRELVAQWQSQYRSAFGS
eukprot:4326602-Karenia_brevis.AAC.1